LPLATGETMNSTWMSASRKVTVEMMWLVRFWPGCTTSAPSRIGQLIGPPVMLVNFGGFASVPSPKRRIAPGGGFTGSGACTGRNAG
jgi:hypothetical protein